MKDAEVVFDFERWIVRGYENLQMVYQYDFDTRAQAEEAAEKWMARKKEVKK